MGLLQMTFYKYDVIFSFSEFETILTTVELERHEKKMFKLSNEEKERIEKILRRAVDVESGKIDEKDVSLTEDNPDGSK